jgi:excisionase family DNA binding protein
MPPPQQRKWFAMSQLSTGLGHQAALAVAPREAGRLLSMCQTRVYQLMRDGTLESYRDGRARRIPMQAIHNYVARRRAESADRWKPINPPPQLRGRASKERA